MSRIALVGIFASALLGAASAQPQPTPADDGVDEGSLYAGWRAQAVLGQTVSAEGKQVGAVRDIIINRSGQIAAVIVQGDGPVDVPDFVFRVPWSEVKRTSGSPGLEIASADSRRPQYGLFPGTESVATLPREFRVSEVIGDYARLQSGYGFGYVTGVVFAGRGQAMAVLVSRDVPSAGGTYAFPFTGVEGRWDPGASYFGLPQVTIEQAMRAGRKVDPKKFKAEKT